jgi:hypothetical protein
MIITLELLDRRSKNAEEKDVLVCASRCLVMEGFSGGNKQSSL